MKVTYGAIVQRASGRFGGTVHSNWKGIDVVRRFAKPSNPNSADQQLVRKLFQNLTTLYGQLPTNTKAAWTTWATGKPFIARNGIIQKNPGDTGLGALDTQDMTIVPGDSSTLPPTAIATVPAAGQITATLTLPTAPSGWTISGGVAAAVKQGDLMTVITAVDLRVFEGVDAAAPCDTPIVTGLPSGTYDCFGFIKWTAPDGSTRYSSAVVDNTIIVP